MVKRRPPSSSEGSCSAHCLWAVNAYREGYRAAGVSVGTQRAHAGEAARDRINAKVPDGLKPSPHEVPVSRRDTRGHESRQDRTSAAVFAPMTFSIH